VSKLGLVPAEAVGGIKEEAKQLFEDLGSAYLDTVLAAKGDNRILLSDDLPFSVLAAEAAQVKFRSHAARLHDLADIARSAGPRSAPLPRARSGVPHVPPQLEDHVAGLRLRRDPRGSRQARDYPQRPEPACLAGAISGSRVSRRAWEHYRNSDSNTRPSKCGWSPVWI